MEEEFDPRFEQVYAVLMSYKMALATVQDEHARTVISSLGDMLIRVLAEWAGSDAEVRPDIEVVLDRAGIGWTRSTGLSD